MRALVFLLSLALAAPASAQLVVPLATADGRIACVQGKTGIGRPSEWRAVADPDGPHGWALAEMAGDATDSRFPLCIAERAVGRDLDATLRFKPVSGSRAQVAGLVFRAQNANDYYFVQANALDKTVRLYRMEKGKRSQLARKDAPIEAGKWHSLRVVAANDPPTAACRKRARWVSSPKPTASPISARCCSARPSLDSPAGRVSVTSRGAPRAAPRQARRTLPPSGGS